ncbi:MAG: hypothetical protein H5U08_16395 [Thermogutta sp.]|uniref:hypothetical protein n=1 Tax=Thermogutta sp. TaxID=1962930 RepID=UPI001987352E|nr:hypothetical protein [Thermogutta sp.]MBC7353940.1 hypothetical protein [Thermogutta sp.]
MREDQRRNHRSEEWLGGLLRAAAQAERPEFSEDLHRRILRQVMQSGVVDESRAAQSFYSRQRWHVMLAWTGAAVAVLLAVLTVTSVRHGGLRFGARPNSEEVANGVNGQPENLSGGVDPSMARETELSPDRSLAVIVSTPDRTVQQLQHQLTQLESGRWAGLDRDLLIASEMVKNQLPLNLVAQIRTGEAQRTP